MKRNWYLILVFIGILAGLGTGSSNAQAPSSPKFLKPFFKKGETLKYVVRYGFIRCGLATIKVEDVNQLYKEKKAIHFSAEGETAGTFDFFYKVRNRYDSYVDSESLLPFSYIEHIQENKYQRGGESDFNYAKKEVKTPKVEIAMQENTRDILSAFYYARSLDLKELPSGSKFQISYYLEGSVSSLEVTYLGKETITTGLGKFNCLKFSPSVTPGRIFRQDSKMYLWITDDQNRVPIRARAEIIVGAVTMDLKDYSNLNEPLKSE